MQRNRTSFDQELLLEKYQLIVQAFNRVGIKLVELNPKGLCFGLNANYIKFAHEGKREEFLGYLEFIVSVDETTLATALNDYVTNKDSVVSIGTETFQLSKLEKLLESIQSHQESQVFGAKWSKTYSFICPKAELSRQLKTAGIMNGSFMVASFGLHVTTIEKIPQGFYVFEANNIKPPKLLATEEEVAQEIIENLNITNVFIRSPDRVAFYIQFVSHENNCAFDGAITAFANVHAQAYPTVANLISLYRRERISRDDLALALWDEIQKLKETTPVKTEARALFVAELEKYIKEQNLPGVQEQYHFESHVNDTAYVFRVSLLDLASWANQINFVKKLLVSGANPDLRDRWIKDPVLYHASARQDLEVMNLLLAYKADPNFPLDDGSTPLYVAASLGHLRAVEMLLANNADPDLARPKDGATPLCIAAQRGDTKMVKALLAKANPDLAIFNGETPLFIAASGGHLQVVKALLAKNADPYKARKDGATPLDVAEDPGMVSALLAAYTARQRFFVPTRPPSKTRTAAKHGKDALNGIIKSRRG